MSLGTAQQVTQAVAQAIRTRDGPRLAAALELDMGNTSLMTQLGGQSVQLEQLCGTALEEPYDEMLLEHFQFLRAVIRDDHVQAFAHQERTCTCFQSVFEKDSAWSLPVLHVLDLGLRRAAQRADAQLASRGEKRCKLEEAARTLQKSFQYTVSAAATPTPTPTPYPLHVTPLRSLSTPLTRTLTPSASPGDRPDRAEGVEEVGHAQRDQQPLQDLL